MFQPHNQPTPSQGPSPTSTGPRGLGLTRATVGAPPALEVPATPPPSAPLPTTPPADHPSADQSPAPAGPPPTSTAARSAPVGSLPRVRAQGKFLYAGDEKFLVRGVTYGPFPPGPDGQEYPPADDLDRDFAAMRAAGVNALRTYTVPPRALLDAAAAHGLRVMVGVPWEQHVAFLDSRRIARRIVKTVRESVRTIAGHPAVLCHVIGNEIPAPIVRWHGRRAVERFLKRLYRAAKREDPQALVTYVNYPSTEYLSLDFLDFSCFNVYLEERDRLEAYLARLQNLAGERPLVMAEIGLDSDRNGLETQAESLRWQVGSSFRAGCAGAFVFSWSDRWYRGGCEIEDWSFGLVDRAAQPKPALTAVREAFANPFDAEGRELPFMSVVICTYNGSRTIRECLEGVSRISFDPERFEVVVVNDGSTDATGEIIDEFPVRHIRIPNGGLSNARNVGMREARGDIVAYIDDDAYPEPDWLSYLALAFLNTTHVGIGGPNLAPVESCFTADCVANSPGGPSHVLHTDVLAEHLPGCNMAFRRDAIMAIDGFDVQFRIAGDDVDLCWRLLERGGTLGFNAGALVWHHRRNSTRTYLRQQRNYGKAEAMLETKWPGKYNRLGHLRWAGQLYGKGHTQSLALQRKRVLHGVWGSRLFQSMYSGKENGAWSLTLMPEWYLVTSGLLLSSLLGFLWTPMFAFVPLFFLATGVQLVQAVLSARQARFTSGPAGRWQRWKLEGYTAILHLLQPLARLVGRLARNLTPWRRHGVPGLAFAVPRTLNYWSETWREPLARIETLEARLKHHRVPVRRGGESDRWDLQATCGFLGSTRFVTTVEEHGQGRQLVRVRAWPRMTRFATIVVPLFLAGTAAALLDGAPWAGGVLGALALVLIIRMIRECSNAMFAVKLAMRECEKEASA